MEKAYVQLSAYTAPVGVRRAYRLFGTPKTNR